MMTGNYSIRHKLMAMSVLASVGPLLLACVSFMIYDYFSYRSFLVIRLSSLEDIISLNSVSAVMAHDHRSADKTLDSLRIRDSIHSAAIFTPDGRVFASWDRDASTPVQPPPASTVGKHFHHFDRQFLTVFHPIVLNNSVIGTVFLKSDLRELSWRFHHYIGISLGVLIASLFAAAAISFKVGHKIAEPILHLAEVAKSVSEKHDYSVRAEGGGPDETGLLIRTFNAMLIKLQEDGQIQKNAEAEIHKLNVNLEQKVMERTAQLTRSNEALEAFSYSVSHDLRAPLRHIGGFTDLLSKIPALQTDATVSRYLTILTDSVKEMGALIDDLLSFSRMARTEMLKSRVNLARIVEEIIKDFKPQMEGRRVEWKVGPLPEVHGDPAMLRVVFVNLLSNAFKYSRARGLAVIEIGASKANAEWILFVRDNGAGFDMKYAGKLFGVFQRLHSSDQFDGTGIGLAIVRRIVERHGGRTWAEAVVDQGATFYVALPIN